MINSSVIGKLNSLSSNFSKIKKAFGYLWNLLTTSPDINLILPKRDLSVSINKDSVSIVYATSFFSKIKVNGFVNYPTNEKNYPDPKELTSMISLSMKDLGISLNSITLCIPKEWVIFRKIVFPATVKENISDVVSYEIDRITPFKQDETLYDFKIIKDDGKNMTLLIAAASSERINLYIDALKEQGINVSAVTTNVSCINNLISFKEKGSNFIFLDINKNGFIGSFVIQGLPQEFFSGSFSDESSIVNNIASTIRPVKEESSTTEKNIKCFVLFNSLPSSIKENLRLKIGIPVIFLQEMDRTIPFKGNPQNIPFYATGCSIESLWKKATSFNLLKKGYEKKEKRPVAFTLILLLILSSLGAFYMVQPLKIERDKLREIDHQIAIRKDEIRKVEDIKKSISDLEDEIFTIDEFKNSKPLSILVLKELTSTLPKTDWITRLKISDSGVTIEGYAESATRLLQKLEASKYFKKVEFVSPTFRDTRLNSERFSMKMEIEGIKDNIKAKPSKTGEDEE